ncbi:glycoside hydrolase superfamily [Phlyctochytrium arcticum]|nr:glycoside hydrolase superfamily [Phlyctochytrium arcticum]
MSSSVPLRREATHPSPRWRSPSSFFLCILATVLALLFIVVDPVAAKPNALAASSRLSASDPSQFTRDMPKKRSGASRRTAAARKTPSTETLSSNAPVSASAASVPAADSRNIVFLKAAAPKSTGVAALVVDGAVAAKGKPVPQSVAGVKTAPAAEPVINARSTQPVTKAPAPAGLAPRSARPQAPASNGTLAAQTDVAVGRRRILEADVHPSGFSMFEIPARPWIYDLQQKRGSNIRTLNDIPDSELQYFQDRKIDVLWLQGVWTLGTWALENVDRVEKSRVDNYNKHLPGYSQDDVIGSPYAVKEYKVSPELGGDEALAKLRQRLADRGIKLMLDFVPNHVAVDCTWCSQDDKKDFFIQRPQNNPPANIDFDGQGRAHGRDLYSGAWVDTLQLNYWNPKVHQAMKNEIIKVAGQCDMLRNDMGMLLLNDVIERTWGPVLRANGYTPPATDFWTDVLPAIRSAHPNFFMTAEVYDWQDFKPALDTRLQGLGFNSTYDKSVYDLLAAKNPHLDNIRNYLRSKGQEGLRHGTHFVENHDEERAVVEFEEKHKSAAVASLTLPGPRLMWYGELEGKRKRLLVQLRRSTPEPVNEDLANFYRSLLNTIALPIFHEGQWELADVRGTEANTAWRLISYKWTLAGADGSDSNPRNIVVVVNHSNSEGQGRILLSDPAAQGDMVPVKELLSGKVYQRNRQEMTQQGLWVVVAPWSAQIFAY